MSIAAFHLEKLTVLAGFVVSILLLSFAAVALARPLTASEHLLLVQYEYDHSEAMGEMFGLASACHKDATVYRKLYVLRGGFNTTFGERREMLSADEQQRALSNWEIGRSQTATLPCTPDSSNKLNAIGDRMVRDFSEQLLLITKADSQ